MYKRIIQNDIRNTKLVTAATVLFVITAALLVSLSSILLVSLLGASETLMDKAKTPHVIQMHSGKISEQRMYEFAEKNDKIDQFQIAEFLNMENAEIKFEHHSMADSVDDNGFTVQNKEMDYLLDTKGNKIQAKDGEAYIPVFYWRKGFAEIGDKLTVHGKEFTVAGLMRDSQMNASMANSKRILISDGDYKELKDDGHGRVEYLIEMRAKKMADVETIETEYTDAELGSNGPLIGYRNLKLINGLSDGIIVAIIMLIAILVTLIAFLCIRFTLLAKIEDEYQEIGVMKAIGLRNAEIKRLYLAKYTLLAAAGCAVGFGLSFFFRKKLTENIRLYMGESNNAFLAPLFAFIGVICVFLVIILVINWILRVFKKLPTVEALRFGRIQENRKRSSGMKLSANRLFSTNAFLGVKDVWNRKRLYITMLAVLIVCSFVTIVPQNLYNTVSHRDFATYMGFGGDFDLQFDINSEDSTALADKLMQNIMKDKNIDKYAQLSTKVYKVPTGGGVEKQIQVSLGDHDTFPVTCYEGRLPETEDEIALSMQNADALEKKLGDTITLNSDEKQRKLKISGLYSDVNNGGKTAKAIFSDSEADTWHTGIMVKAADGVKIDKIISDYEHKYPQIKISEQEKFRMNMYGHMIKSMKMVSYGALGVTLFLTVLITALFMKMLIAKDRYSIAVLKASGYTRQDITSQYAIRFIMVLMISIIVGTLLASVAGEPLALSVMSMMGVKYMDMIINPFTAYVLIPFLMILAVLFAVLFGVGSIKKVNIMENIKE